MALARREYFELSGHPKCQCCENRFPKEFADRCLGWSGGPEEYTLNELIEYCGVDWKAKIGRAVGQGVDRDLHLVLHISATTLIIVRNGAGNVGAATPCDIA